MSKHEDIIQYINSLDVGTKISVRKVANDLGVSDGTAYRAIKGADVLGIVTTIPRVGTIRIEKVEKKSIEVLTYDEVLNIIDGVLLGGRDGVHKTLHRFVIGAMTVEAMEKYISPNCLVILGNREEAQKLALENKAAVLITGGFQCSDYIKNIANEKKLPVISTSYDTFTVATMINKAISECLIKKEIILIEDIMKVNGNYIKESDSISEWHNMINKSDNEKYPVVNDDMEVVGIVTLKDISNSNNKDEIIRNIMKKKPQTLTPKTTVSYAAHLMSWNEIQICPVVDKNKKLIGIVTIQDIIKALQYVSRQPHVGDNIEDLICKNFQLKECGEKIKFTGKVIPQMLDSIGTASWSSLNMIMSTIATMHIRRKNTVNIFVDSISTYFMKPVQIDTKIELESKFMNTGKSFCKVEVEMCDSNKELIGKLLMSAKLIRR